MFSQILIRLTGLGAKAKCAHELRVVRFHDAEQDRSFEFLTNNFKLASSTIAAMYKDRWAVGSSSKHSNKT